MAVSVDDPGRKARFEILHRDVERKILEPLRTHNWAADIEREVGEGEYVIVAAERANGAPYMVESFAHGLDRPVETIDAFPTLLQQWNAVTADGKFAPVANPPLTAPTTRRPFRMLLSEQPIESIWLRLRQLQSVTLARKLIEERARREGSPLDAAASQWPMRSATLATISRRPTIGMSASAS